MGVAVPERLLVVKRFALLVIPALLAANLAVASGTSVVLAGGNVDTVTVPVLGGPLGNITTSPLTLSPAFDQATTDYVLRCHTGVNAVQVTLSAASSGEIAIGKDRGNSLTINVNLVENQALIISGPGQRGANRASASAQSGQTDSAQPSGLAQYWIRCLPSDFPLINVTRPGNPPTGWYVTGTLYAAVGAYAMVLDSNGTPVWYRKSGGLNAVNVTPLPDGSLAWVSDAQQGFGVDPNARFEDYNLATQTTTFLAAPEPPLDFHELQAMSNGDLMMLSSPLKRNVDMSSLGFGSNVTIVDCLLQEVDPGGAVVWQWRASDHISVSESLHPFATHVSGELVYEPFHCNSVDTNPRSSEILLSARHTDAVYMINKSSGKIIWRLGGGTRPGLDNEPILTMEGDPDGAFHGQHDARFQPNGEVSLFDDESWDASLAARAVVYRIDVASGTATLIWSYQSPDGHNVPATGSFRRLDGGSDNVIGWGVKPNTMFTEVDSNGNVMMNVTFPNGEDTYRVIKVGLGALDHNLLRATAGLPRQ